MKFWSDYVDRIVSISHSIWMAKSSIWWTINCAEAILALMISHWFLFGPTIDLISWFVANKWAFIQMEFSFWNCATFPLGSHSYNQHYICAMAQTQRNLSKCQQININLLILLFECAVMRCVSLRSVPIIIYTVLAVITIDIANRNSKHSLRAPIRDNGWQNILQQTKRNGTRPSATKYFPDYNLCSMSSYIVFHTYASSSPHRWPNPPASSSLPTNMKTSRKAIPHGKYI